MCETCGCNENIKKINIEKDIFDKNKEIAERNRQIFNYHGLLVLNLVSSPGAGKTTLLEKTIMDLKDRFSIGVIEGDQHTSRDADRIAKTNVPVYQINTLSACHLDAHMIKHILDKLPLNELDILFIENVGNLICPSEFDLGEDFKVVISSITEGEDKALKYPGIFMNSLITIINKIDLLDILDFDLARCISFIRRINPKTEIVTLSAKTGEGIDGWYTWIKKRFLEKKGGKDGSI